MARRVEILLIEDSREQAVLTKMLFSGCKVANNFHIVSDGEKAVKFLQKKGFWLEVPTPDLILLDLSLPKKSGADVLRFIRQSEELKTIPVLILSASTNTGHLDAILESANSYFEKPASFKLFSTLVQEIERRWLVPLAV